MWKGEEGRKAYMGETTTIDKKELDRLKWFYDRCVEMNYARIAMNNDKIGTILNKIGAKLHVTEGHEL